MNNQNNSVIGVEFFTELDKFCDKYGVKLTKDYNSNNQLVLFTNVKYNYESDAFITLKE